MVYDLIKGRLLRFRKTYEEKQTLALSDWNNLYKGALTALEFETKWERVIRKLARYGLERGTQELLLGYYCKISKQAAKEIKKDRRVYPNADGTETVRQCATWEEAHLMAIEIEEDNAATKATTNPNFYNSPYSHSVSYGEAKDRKAKGEGKTGKNSDRPKGVCFDMIKNGKCDRENCRYSHDKKAVAAAKYEKGRKGAAIAAVDAADPDWTAKAYQKGKEKKGKSKGKGEEKWPVKGENGSDPQSKKHNLCKSLKKERNVQRHVRIPTIKLSLRKVTLRRPPIRQQEHSVLLLQV